MRKNQRQAAGAQRPVAVAVRDNPEPALRRRYGGAWAEAWLGVVVIAFLNGVLHRAYSGRLGELRAHQVSCGVLLILLAPWVLHTERRHPLPAASSAMKAGLGWSAATVTFEFVFGHYINRNSWAELLNDYDLREGRLWLLVVVGIAAAPTLARARRLRRGHHDRQCDADR